MLFSIQAHLKPEGNCLLVEPRRVVITGADEPGLYYATVMLFQLMSNSMRIRDSMPIPCVEILDWPDMTICCFYENGVKDKYEKITFARFNLEWLTKGKDGL